MKQFFLLLVIVAVSATESQENSAPLPALHRAIRETGKQPAVNQASVDQTAASSSEDLANAETFGFGYHKHIHARYGGYYGPRPYYYPYPAYYPQPRFYAQPGYYPHPGYYGNPYYY